MLFCGVYMLEKCKELRLENVISLRKRIPQNEIRDEMNKLRLFINDNALKKTGPIVTATFSIDTSNSQPVLDMEIIIPVDKSVDSIGDYCFKKAFHIVNAVYEQHKGDPSLLQNTYNKMISYIHENNLQQITAAYNVNVNELQPGQSIDDIMVDVYIGVNPSVL